MMEYVQNRSLHAHTKRTCAISLTPPVLTLLVITLQQQNCHAGISTDLAGEQNTSLDDCEFQ